MSNLKNALRATIVALTITLALPMLAQAEADEECPGSSRGPGGWNHREHRGSDPAHFLDRHGDELGLDSETREAIQAIVDDSRSQSETMRGEIRSEYEAMRALLSQSLPDEAAVMAQHERIDALKSRQRKHRLEAMLAIRKLLTPDQREQLVGMREERRREHAECRACMGGDGPGDCDGCRKGRWGALKGCRKDVASLCSQAEPGRARLRCLDAKWEELSDSCRAAFEERGRRGPGPDRSDEPEAE